ncbi:MAG TPA: S8 family serine peptidase [Phycisphaerae bacterium]|nr:S8 family serine peptidase [Phycisphaerae bacterium]
MFRFSVLLVVASLSVVFCRAASAETPKHEPAAASPATLAAPSDETAPIADDAAQNSSTTSMAAFKDPAEANYSLVPPSAEELAARDAASPKRDGAVALANLDRSTPMSANPALPNYYYYHGQPVALPMDVTRVAVRMAGDAVGDAGQLLATPDVGVEAIQIEAIGIDGWQFVTLAQPLADLEDANQRITAILANAAVEFASPVFRSLLIPDGWVVFAPDVLVRFDVNHRDGAAAVISELADGFEVREDRFGGMDGAYRLGGSPRNGFEVLAQANRLSLDPRVEWAQPETMFTGQGSIWPNDPEFDDLWGIYNSGQGIAGLWGVDDMDMDGEEAWNITRGVAGVRVLVIETGVQQDHPDINQDAGRDFTTHLADGFAGGGPGNMCDNHGTAVAGCISARFNNGIGPVGIAPQCRVVSARVGVADIPCDQWTGFNSWTANALNWARNQGIQITNNSNDYGALDNAIDAAYSDTYGDGLTHFASSGNSGAASIAYPASADTVNAVGNLRNNGTLSPDSQTGTGLDFVAPGTSIRTTDRTGGDGYVAGDYVWANGTSFASPYAAGVAALVKTAHPAWNPINIESAMKASSRDLGAPGYDTSFGWGLVNGLRAIEIFGPDNDLCTNPRVIPGTVYNPGSIITYNATSSTFFEPQEGCEQGNVGVSNSVWYSYTPPANGVIDLNTWGSNYDTVLSVFNGCGIYVGTDQFFFATQLGCNDDTAGTLQSEILGVPVTGGANYLIKVSDYNTTSGGGELFVDLYFYYGPPANDLCPNRTSIPVTGGTHHMPPVYTPTATVFYGDCTEPYEDCGHPEGNSNSVWYSFVPAAGGHITVDTFGSNYDTVMTIFDGSGFSNPCGEYWDGQDGPICIGPHDFGQYVCNDDSFDQNWFYQSRIANYPVIAGRPYMVKVSDYNPTSGGGWMYLNLTFEVEVPPPAGGDVNGDGNVDPGDAPFMVAAMLDPDNCGGCDVAEADMNGDAAVDGMDLQPFVDAVMGG